MGSEPSAPTLPLPMTTVWVLMSRPRARAVLDVGQRRLGLGHGARVVRGEEPARRERLADAQLQGEAGHVLQDLLLDPRRQGGEAGVRLADAGPLRLGLG